jgi:hypothetical protein
MKNRLPRSYSFTISSTGNLGCISSILGQLAPSSPGAAAEDDAAAVEPSGRAFKLPNIPFAAAFSATQAGSTIYFCLICSYLVSGFFGPSEIRCGKGCLICSYLVSIFFRPFCDLLRQGFRFLFDLKLPVQSS